MSRDNFTLMMPVQDSAAEDEVLLAEAERMILDEWPDRVREAGGEPLDEPTVTHEPNPNYGMVVCDERGEPTLREDGEPVVDHTKLYVFARGWAER